MDALGEGSFVVRRRVTPGQGQGEVLDACELMGSSGEVAFVRHPTRSFRRVEHAGLSSIFAAGVYVL